MYAHLFRRDSVHQNPLLGNPCSLACVYSFYGIAVYSVASKDI